MQQQNPQKVEASKVPEYIKKAAKKAAEFNSNFNRERMEERRAYFDLQTHVRPGKTDDLLTEGLRRKLCVSLTGFMIKLCVFSQIIQVPQGRFKVLAPELTRTGPYPVALIPGQFQDYYKRYIKHFVFFLLIKIIILYFSVLSVVMLNVLVLMHLCS